MDHSETDHGSMDHSKTDHSTMDHGKMAMDKPAAPPASGPPPRALGGAAHAADVVYGTAAMAPTRVELARENGGFAGSTIMLDRLEARVGKGSDAYLWDGQGWTGNDTDKLWIKSEGEGAFGDKIEDAEMQALWSHAIGPWFDVQAGVRYTIEPVARPHLALGVQGLAPYMFDVDAAAFLSDKGDLTARIEAEYDQRLTQRLILQPRVEFDIAAQDIPEFGIGSGPSKLEAGLRLRYEIVREFAPYVGVEWERKVGGTADAARLAGDDPSRVFLVIGVRAWF
jgi:copper resistance protein B